MPNPSIAMSVNGLDTATPITNAQNQQNTNAQSAEQTLKAHYEAMDAREKSRLSSTIVGAAQLKPFLDNNDTEGALDFLQRRKAALHQRMGLGENIDTQETDYAIQALQNGQVDELKNGINGLMAAGQVYGILNPANTAGGDTGILVDRLIKEGSAKDVNEALQLIKGGAGQAGKNAADINTGYAANNATQSGKNDADIAAAAPKAQNEALGAGGGKAIIENNDTLGSLDNLNYSIQQAQQLLPKVAATGPILGRAGNAAEDPDYKNLQGAINAITLQAKDLYNLGSGAGFTDTDRDFLRDVIAGKYARAETIQMGLQRFQEALQHRQQFLQTQNQNYQGGNYNYNSGGQQQPQPQTQGTPAAGSQKITVTNGKETYQIDPSDLAAAQAEGFQQQ